MINFCLFLKSLYSKQKTDVVELNLRDCLVLSRYLSLDKNNADILRKAIGYLYYINSKHYYYYLFFKIKKNNMPFFQYPKKQKQKTNILLEDIVRLFNWNKRDLEANKNILKKVIFKKKKFWKEKFGIN